MDNRNIYARLGVPTIINGKGTSTRVSGGIMDTEVADAMREATQACVDMGQLQGRASEIIAELTGAEAGYVTSGAAAGLLLGTAACVTGLDPGRMNRLPDTRGLPNRVIVVRSQRNLYDHAVRAVGVELVEVGIADRYAGPGVRDAEAWEIADAIDERTACVFYVAQSQSRPPLAEVVTVAHAAGVPVLVDAAAQLPPVDNLRRFIDAGADLVTFSGGKALLGPQASGVLCGRRDLIAAAAMHNLDHDIFFEQWAPPPGLIDKAKLRGLPQHGIGRACKAGKEQIVGLLVALQRFDQKSMARRNAVCSEHLAAFDMALDSSLPLAVERYETVPGGEPRVRLTLDASAPLDAMALVIALQDGEPSIQLDPFEADRNCVTLIPTALREGEGATIARRIAEVLAPS
jgi:D-glucosaminate-6-phosphate ammonia-lyase